MPGADSPRSESEIFVSYSQEDATRVQVLVTALEVEGWKVFWDQSIPYGEDWDSHIGVHLDAAPVVVVVWSYNSIKSRYVREEANRALKRNSLVPVQIDPVDQPFGFGHLNVADLADWLAIGGGILPPRLKSSILRRIVSQSDTLDPESTVVVRQRGLPPAAVAAPARTTSKKRPRALWIGAGIVAMLLIGGGSYTLRESLGISQQKTVDRSAQDSKLAEEAQRLRDAEELAKLRAEAAARQKSDEEAANRRQNEEQERRKAEEKRLQDQQQAELAARQRAQAEEAKRKAEAEIERRKAEEKRLQDQQQAELAARQRAQAGQYEEASRLLKAGDYPGAERALKQHIAWNPQGSLTARAWRALGDVYRHQHKLEDASAAYGESYRLFKSTRDTTSYYEALVTVSLLAKALIEVNRKPEACAAFVQFRQDYSHQIQGSQWGEVGSVRYGCN
jgi:TolA-binding protein